MGIKETCRAVTLALLLIWASTAHAWGEYERVACLTDQQQLPVYQIAIDYTTQGRSLATAVVVAPGYALTASHAVDGDVKMISILTPQGPRAATLIASDPINDLALLSLETTGMEMLPFYTVAVRPGELVYTVGFAGDAGISYKGPVLVDSGGHLTIGAPVFPGMSGGAVVICNDGKPYLAGIIESFNYRITRRWIEETPRHTKIYERIVNDGTSNGPSGQLAFWFTEYAIEHNEKREKNQ